MMYRLEELRQGCRAGRKYKFHFFWGHTPPADGSVDSSCLSQWWKCMFSVDGQTYNCAEQYMMAEKARLFGDQTKLESIMKTDDPKEMKTLGRAVSRFDSAIWDAKCYDTVKTGNYAKFAQNPDLWLFLKSTHDRILVEASPVDRIWGIGMAQNDPNAANPMKWRGSNLLGFALTEVRDLLLDHERGV